MKTVSYAWVLAILGMLAFTAASIRINQQEVWFSNLDQDSVLLINALRVNDGRPPTYFDHPSQGVYLVYGRLLQAASMAGLSPVGRFSEIESHRDPVVLMPGIFDAGRAISILVCIMCAVVGAAAIYLYTLNWEYAALGSAFLFGSSGLLLQSLLVRSELTSVLFLCCSILMLMLFRRYPHRRGTLFLVGTAFGLAYATKIQVLPFAGLILLVIAWILSRPPMGDDEGDSDSVFRRMLGAVPTLLGIGVVSALGFTVISVFSVLVMPYALYQAWEATSLPWRAGSALLLAAIIAPAFIAYRRYRAGMHAARDRLTGAAVIGCSLLLLAFPLLVSGLEHMRGKVLPEAYHVAGWQVVLLALSLFALGCGVLWQRQRGATLSLHVRVASMLLAGFMAGIVTALVASAGMGDPSTLGATNSRLFTFVSMSEFSTSASAPSMAPLVRELGTYLHLYLLRNYLLLGYGALLVYSLTFVKVSSRYLWPSLMLAATGLMFMVICSFRYYVEQYWIYIDLFFISAAALLVCGLIEKRPGVRVRVAAVAILVALYATQYPRVFEDYPHYNPLFRDRIDLAAYAVHEVHDYAVLMRERYGDDVGFMKRVLSDPDLNGADRGIDLMSKPGIRKLIAANPHVQAAVAQSGRYRP